MSKEYTFKQLENNNLKNIPDSSGVYKIYAPKNLSLKLSLPKFKEGEKQFTNENMDDAKECLKAVQNDFSRGRLLLYIGKAKNLRRRIKQYLDYGNGKGRVHRGGRFIFAINDWRDLIVHFEEFDDYEYQEAQAIDAYFEKYQHLPFANKKREHINKATSLNYTKFGSKLEHDEFYAVNKYRAGGVTDVPIAFGLNDMDYDDDILYLYNDEEDGQ